MDQIIASLVFITQQQKEICFFREKECINTKKLKISYLSKKLLTYAIQLRQTSGLFEMKINVMFFLRLIRQLYELMRQRSLVRLQSQLSIDRNESKVRAIGEDECGFCSFTIGCYRWSKAQSEQIEKTSTLVV